MRREAAGLTLSITLSIACALIAGCLSEEQETHYMTLTAARMEGAVHRGWVPEWLPKNAHTIKEKHDLDTNRSILRFAFPEADKWVPPDSCVRIKPSEIRGPAMRASWWPKEIPSTDAATPRYNYYSCAEAREFLAVDFPRGDVLHWRP